MLKSLRLLASLPAAVRRFSPSSLVAPPRDGLIGPIALPEHDSLLETQAVQWWYWTGHLDAKRKGSSETRAFGFELVFFVFHTYEVVKATLGQIAITDRAGQRFRFRNSVVVHLPDKEEGRFTIVGEGESCRAEGGSGNDRLSARFLEGDAFDLDLTTNDAAAEHYAGFPHPLRCGGFTYYYSRPHQRAEGTLRFDGVDYEVTGEAWFDRQYGELFQLIERGWQWFAISLADGRRIMIFDFPEGPDRVENIAAIMTPGGGYRLVQREDVHVDVLATWTSPSTKTIYPSRWRVRVGDFVCEIEPWVPDQELCPNATVKLWIGPEYWEGACDVFTPGTREVIGRAYIELNGYADSGVIARTMAFLAELFR